MVAAIGEQILARTDVSLSNGPGHAHRGSERGRLHSDPGGEPLEQLDPRPRAPLRLPAPARHSLQLRGVHVRGRQRLRPPVRRARNGVGQQVRGDRLSLEGGGPDLHAVQVQRARRLLHQPGDQAAEGAEVQLRDSARRHREVQARRAPDALRGRAEEGAGDAHVVVVGHADVHHQVGGRAQPVPAAAEGVASRRRPLRP